MNQHMRNCTYYNFAQLLVVEKVIRRMIIGVVTVMNQECDTFQEL